MRPILPEPTHLPGTPVQAMSPDTPLVLLVDDNADIRELYGLVLTNAGFQVIDAPDGEVAVELARSARPNAIVMDIDMPRMNGLDAIRLLRQQTHTSRTPIRCTPPWFAKSSCACAGTCMSRPPACRHANWLPNSRRRRQAMRLPYNYRWRRSMSGKLLPS